MQTPASETNDAGAALLVVLVLLLGVGLICSGLVAFTRTELQTAQALSTDRAVTYAADNAVELAIQQVRYQPATYATPSDCTNRAGGIATNGVSVIVQCSAVSGGTGREIQFRACQSTNLSCHVPTVMAVVSFDDIAAECSRSVSSGCGESARIMSWVTDGDG